FDPDGNGRGEPVARHRKPALPPQAMASPPTGDEFEAPTLGRQWQWQANPQPEWAALEQGGLRLRSVPAPAEARNLWPVPSLLLQKPAAPAFVTTTRLTLHARSEGEHAGLLVMGSEYAWLGLERAVDGIELVHRIA